MSSYLDEKPLKEKTIPFRKVDMLYSATILSWGALPFWVLNIFPRIPETSVFLAMTLTGCLMGPILSWCFHDGDWNIFHKLGYCLKFKEDEVT